jgi:hypothetical protein
MSTSTQAIEIISPNRHHLKQKDVIGLQCPQPPQQSSPDHKHKRGVKKNLSTSGLARVED